MNHIRLPALLSILFLVLLTSCSPYPPGRGKYAYCNELNSELVFGGNTSNTREAEIQQAALPLVQKNYDAANCG